MQSESNICWIYNNNNHNSTVWRRNMMMEDELLLMREEGTFCAICWEDLNATDVIKCNNQCSGDFCLNCWKKCMLQSNKCPICRCQQSRSISRRIKNHWAYLLLLIVVLIEYSMIGWAIMTQPSHH